jgi:glycosyltransferase involved in cell wall biosynthesis
LFHFKYFAEFHGSDIRFIYNQNIEYPFYKDNVPPERNIRIARKQRNRLLKRVSGIIIHDHELLPHLPDIKKPVFIVPLRVNLDSIKPAYPDTEDTSKPKIVHAPSKRSTKGTEGILEALKKVKGDYELVLVENMSHDEAMEIYSKADIVIDQIALGTYGVFSIEAMAMGKPVITYISPEMKEHLPQDLPIVSADFDELPETVDALIADPQKRHDLGVRGRAYAERYHDYVKVTKHLYEVYNGTVEENDLFKLL